MSFVFYIHFVCHLSGCCTVFEAARDMGIFKDK